MANNGTAMPISKLIPWMTGIAITVLLPGVGFLSHGMILNGQHIAVLKESVSHLRSAVEMHVTDGGHDDAVSRTELMQAIRAIEKQQELRDVQIRRELQEIKAELKSVGR